MRVRMTLHFVTAFAARANYGVNAGEVYLCPCAAGKLERTGIIF